MTAAPNEPRSEDLLALADELYKLRQQVARLRAENTALRQAWVQFSNKDRLELADAIDKLVGVFIAKGSARLALNAAKIAASASP